MKFVFLVVIKCSFALLCQYLLLTSPCVLASPGRKLHANAEGDSEELVNPPKVEEKIGAVPNGLSTDSDVAKRYEKL